MEKICMEYVMYFWAANIFYIDYKYQKLIFSKICNGLQIYITQTLTANPKQFHWEHNWNLARSKNDKDIGPVMGKMIFVENQIKNF